MGDVLLQLGVGGTFAILMVREVLNFLKYKRNNGNPGHNPGTHAALKQIANELVEIRKCQTDLYSAVKEVETIIRERIPPRN